MITNGKRRAPVASGNAAQGDVCKSHDPDITPPTAFHQPTIAKFLDRPTCMDVARQIDAASLSAKFATVPAGEWRSIGGAS
jgi:hypothetical protein